MRLVFKCLCYFGWWPVCFAGVAALSNFILDTAQSPWVAAVLGAFTGLGMIFVLENKRRGWIRGLIWDPDAKQRLANRRKELADERERIFADAKAE
ncbi:MAG: hypothetical protein IT430_17075 [Phycisphaerales bacterium]|nr:hypothetical protein [Phycisphaerales bacterium]